MTPFARAKKIMATMFKKSKRNFRKKVVHEDDDHGNDRETGNLAAISKGAGENSKPKEKVKSKIKVDKVASSNSLLSFDDEVAVDESEVFKIRKSKESRRLAKKIEQARKKKDKIDDEEGNAKKNDGSFDQGQDVDTDKRLAALRAELNQITREGDDDDDDVDADDDVDSVGSGSVKKEPVTNSSIRTDFSIPDAATIHAARKSREMARQTEQDYIPVDDTKKYEGQFASTGRLVREDENDVSDEEGEEGPITFSVAARKRGFPALDRRRQVEAALANQELEEKSDNEEAEDDEDLKLWEDEQIRKGVKGAPAPLAQTETVPQITEMTNSLYLQQYTEDTNSVMQISQPYTFGTGYTEIHTNGNQIYGRTMTSNSLQSRHAVTVDMICDKMKQQLTTLQEVHRGHQMDREKASSQLETAQGSIKKLERQGRNAEQRFSFFQETRGYVRDLIECLNNKVGDTSMI